MENLGLYFLLTFCMGGLAGTLYGAWVADHWYGEKRKGEENID